MFCHITKPGKCIFIVKPAEPSIEISQVTFEINKKDQDDADEKETICIPTKESFQIEKFTKDAQKFEIKNLKSETKYQIRAFYEHKFGINGKFSNIVEFETRKRLRLFQ